MAKRESHWAVVAFKTIIGLFVIGPLLLAANVTIQLLSLATGGHRRRNDRGLASEFVRQSSISYVMAKIFRPPEQVSVRDVRVREATGAEHLVRVRGDLVAGNFNIGDEVEVTGTDQGGTILLRYGWNRRTRSKIVARV